MKFIKFLASVVLIIVTVIITLFVKDKIEKQTYKLTYETLIKKYSQEYDLDPYLVAAVIHVESGNRKDVASNKGAIGLMQIMPETGEWIAGKLKRGFSIDYLKDPETNIEFGCWYLRFLCDRFSEMDTVIAAYNAGHNKVAKWLDDSQYSDDGASLATIPIVEAKQYVQKVVKANEKYKKIYPKAFELR